MIVKSHMLALTQDEANAPLIGFKNIVTRSNVTAEYADVSYPASNLGNPSTILRWLSTSTVEQQIEIAVPGDITCDYIAIERHNFGTAQIPVRIEANIGGWVEMTEIHTPADDGPILFRLPHVSATQFRIRMFTGSAAPTIAVVYCGSLLVLPHRIYVGHTPLQLGRDTDILTGVSESGDFLGRIVVGRRKTTSVSLNNLDPAWYRSQFDAFAETAQETPFFFAWRPGKYPNEIGYSWLSSTPKPSNQSPNGKMQVSLQIAGVTL